MKQHYVWLIWSSAFLIPWAALYLARPALRVAMWRASLATMLFGLTEPIFVAEYWNPPSLFELAQRTGFDIESLVFSFALGGIGTVLYDASAGRYLVPASAALRHAPQHRLHRAGHCCCHSLRLCRSTSCRGIRSIQCLPACYWA